MLCVQIKNALREETEMVKNDRDRPDFMFPGNFLVFPHGRGG